MGSTPTPTFPHRKGEGVKKAICLGSLCSAPDLWVRISFPKGETPIPLPFVKGGGEGLCLFQKAKFIRFILFDGLVKSPNLSP